MSEDVKDRVDQEEDLDLISQWQNQEESYEEAVARAAEEDVSFTNIPTYKMDKLGTYVLRILPLAPAKNPKDNRKSYEWPNHVFWGKISAPADKNGKSRKDRNIKFTRLDHTNLNVEIDLINTYRKLAVEEASKTNDEKLTKKINEGSYSGGLKYSYEHSMFVIDADDIKAGIQLLNLSHSQFKDLEEAKFTVWEKNLKNDPKAPCPISSLRKGIPVEFSKRKDGEKTKYTITIDRANDPMPLKEADLVAIMKAPRIPEIIYRFSRFHFEAMIEFLKQYDEKNGLHVMETEEMKAAIATVEAAIPSDDQSHFSWDKKGEETESSESSETALSLDSLYAAFDELAEKELGDKSPEGQELRANILAFIEQEQLDVAITRRISNEEALALCEKALQPGVK